MSVAIFLVSSGYSNFCLNAVDYSKPSPSHCPHLLPVEDMDHGSPSLASLESTAASSESRLSRFADWTVIPKIYDQKIHSPSRQQTLYHAAQSDIRMGEVRIAIEYIRGRWSDYPIFIQELREYIDRLDKTSTYFAKSNDEDRRALESVLSNSRDWADRSSKQANSLDVLNLYISQFGHKTIFRLLNEAFRTDAVTEQGQEKELHSAVFLIELLNIDLFNYISRNPSKSGFQGIAYRGVSFTREEIEDFRNLTTMAVRDRYWSIPLAMVSASTSINTALEFALHNANNDPTKLPFLWRIHVANMDPDLLRIYNERFPCSVVTTLCAVPVSEVSRYSQEQEVVLRGPWFQFIRLHKEFVPAVGTTMDVMDLVMLNTNRDHPSVVEMSVEERDEARKLIALLVGISRTRICRDLAHEYGLTPDADEFARIHDEQVECLRSMTFREDPRRSRYCRLSGKVKGLLQGLRKGCCA